MSNLRPRRKLLARTSLIAAAGVAGAASIAATGSVGCGDSGLPLECYLNDAGPDARPTYLDSSQAGYTCKDGRIKQNPSVADARPPAVEAGKDAAQADGAPLDAAPLDATLVDALDTGNDR